MRMSLQLFFAAAIVTLMTASPIAYKRWQDNQWRNFRVVEEGVLYRSGQMSLTRLQQMVALHGIRTVVSLRDGRKVEDEQEETWVKAKQLNFVRIPYRDWNVDAAGKVPAELSLQEFRDVMDNKANYPVLVHCFAGVHRTGAMCAIFRMDYQGWTNDEAMNEMRAIGYTVLDDHEDVQSFMWQYRPRRRSLGGAAVPIVPVSRQKDTNP